MHDAWHDLLSCATFSQHKHADVGGRNLRRHGQRTVKCGRMPDHPKTSFQRPHIHGQSDAGSSVTSPINVTGVQSNVLTLTYCPGCKSPLGNTTTVLWVVRPKN